MAAVEPLRGAAPLAPLPTTCPEALRHLRIWLPWRLEPGKPGKKPRKVPYYAKPGPDGEAMPRGTNGSLADRAALVTFDEALACIKASRRPGGANYTGPGIAVLPDTGVTILDFDNCIDESGTLHPHVDALVMGTYAEYSPSGKGIHAFMRGDLPQGKDPHSEPFGFETFSASGFVTFTGQQLPGSFTGDDIAPVSDEVRALAKARFRRTEVPHDANPSPPGRLTPSQARRVVFALDPNMAEPQWWQVGAALHYDSGGAEWALDLWEEWSATARADRYDEGETAGRWARFKYDKDKPATAGWLIHEAREHGVDIRDEDFNDLVERAEMGPRKFMSEGFKEARRVSKTPWLIEDFMPLQGLGLIYGESGAGKSFIAIGIAMAVARGVPWCGMETRQGKVVYIDTEGGADFSNRLEAYARYYKVDEADFHVIRNETPDMSDEEDVAQLAAECGECRLILVDTFANAVGGIDENSVKEMTRVLSLYRKLAEKCSALVVPIHHSGKDPSRGARGSSYFKGRVDFEACAYAETPKVKKEEEDDFITPGAVTFLRVTKQRGGVTGKTLCLRRDQVEVGTADNGAPIISAVAVHTAPPGRTKPGRTTTWGPRVVEALGKNLDAWKGGVDIGEVLKVVADGKNETDAARRYLRKGNEFVVTGDTLTPKRDFE